jgi:hypothetical protein
MPKTNHFFGRPLGILNEEFTTIEEGLLLSFFPTRITIFFYMLLAICTIGSARSHAQAALLIEQPYGFFGTINPTGHNAIYFERICAETPVKLRRCEPGELGAVLSRYQGISGYDWVAIPLVPYLYSVENVSSVPADVDAPTVKRMRNHYHEAHLLSLGENLPEGNLIRGGWKQLIGTSYERRIYAFRFETTEEQDDALIAWLNGNPNRSHFNLVFNNCADFARKLLNFYFPGKFSRSIFPDAGMTTPKHIAYSLARYARKHPETQLTVFEIPQIPGYRRQSHANKSVAESLTTTLYAIPIALVSPYLAGGLFVDYFVRGRYRVIPKHPQVATPDDLVAWARSSPASSSLTCASHIAQNPEDAGIQAPGAAVGGTAKIEAPLAVDSGLKEMKAMHE